ncbi:MAG: methylamine utilization protein [Acidobacteriales bacterium]|nr:methylamine utilization protein [Terriglobales bacterium]
MPRSANRRRSLITISISLALILPGCTGGNFATPAAQVAPGTLTVTAAAASIRVEQTTQLAVEGFDTAAVSWSVNGIPGGNDTVGYIYATGKYQAPAALPADKQAIITAASIANPAVKGSTTIALLNPVPVIFAIESTERSDSSVLLDITGKDFVAGATVKVGAITITPQLRSSTELQAAVPAAIAALGIRLEVTVANPEPGAANSDTIAVARPSRPSRDTVATSHPNLPAAMFDYVKYAVTDVPAQYTNPNAPFGNVPITDNTPAANPITNAGATLGRVLFYDKRLSVNNTVACASCHQQAHGFSDPAKLSVGFLGGTTGRHAMGLSNSRYYQRAHFFWDERALTLEDQTLQPIQNSVEMGMTLSDLQTKLAATDFYPALFQAAFGTPQVTSDRISKALSQFIRSMVTYQSKYDQAFAAGTNGTPNFTNVFTASEQRGQKLFGSGPNGGPSLGCDRCHGTAANVSNNIQNNGLDAVTTDAGAGNGRFKAPSLRNIAARAPYMHDGRFTTLDQVIEFYNSGVQNNPDLSPLLRVGGNPGGAVVRLNMTAQDKADLAAFLQTLTDTTFMSDVKFSNPFN